MVGISSIILFWAPSYSLSTDEKATGQILMGKVDSHKLYKTMDERHTRKVTVEHRPAELIFAEVFSM